MQQFKQGDLVDIIHPRYLECDATYIEPYGNDAHVIHTNDHLRDIWPDCLIRPARSVELKRAIEADLAAEAHL